MRTRRSAVMSTVGSPSTISRSASRPGCSRPVRPARPHAAAARLVAEASAAGAGTPQSTRSATAYGRIPCGLPGLMPESAPLISRTPARCSAATCASRLSRVAPVASNMARTRAGISTPGAIPRVGQTTVSALASASPSAGGSWKPVEVRHEQCSIASTSAATHCSTAGRAWAWAVIARPSRCASSTAAHSSGSENWHANTSVPGVITPPLVMTLTMSAPRSARSATARRSSAGPDTTPPIAAQWPPAMVSGGPDATTVGPSASPRWRSTTAQWWSPRSRTAVTPAASCRRFDMAMTASRSPSSSSGSWSSARGPLSPHRCVCASIRPGSSVVPGR